MDLSIFEIRMKNYVPQGSVLGLVLFNIFINDIDNGIECTLSKFADDTKPSGQKSKCKVLHLGQGNPRAEHSLGEELTGSSPAEKDLGVLVDKKLHTSQQRVPAAQQANCVLGCTTRGVASRGGRGSCPSALPWSGPAWSAASRAGAPAQGGRGAVRAGPEGGHEVDQRAGAPLL